MKHTRTILTAALAVTLIVAHFTLAQAQQVGARRIDLQRHNLSSTSDFGQPMSFETIKVRKEGAVLFAELSAPPMNLLATEMVRDLVTLIQQAEVDLSVQVLVFRSADPDYFISHVDVTRISEYRKEAEKLTGEPSGLQRRSG